LVVKFTRHAKSKLKVLSRFGITEEIVIKVLSEADEILYDTLRDRLIAINYSLNIAIPFEEEDGDTLIITILYSSKLKDIVRRRKRAGRWI